MTGKRSKEVPTKIIRFIKRLKTFKALKLKLQKCPEFSVLVIIDNFLHFLLLFLGFLRIPRGLRQRGFGYFGRMKELKMKLRFRIKEFQ